MMAATPDPALLAELRAALDSTYEIEREIGGGGMSRVFEAVERALGRRVVIKVLPPELTAGVNRERFRREIQFAARLQHPHIVPLLTAGQVGDILYFTMPFVEGETLRVELDRGGRLPAARVVAILQDVVDALAYAHSRGLVHRDIKPENILVQRTHALVTDFGVAKAISAALPGTAATTVGVAVGTPAYMAPEQLAADPAADHRIDLYAVGLLAYELLSGSSPFAGSSPQQTLARQLTERPTPPHIQRADVPAELSAIIMRCLEKEPAARFATAEELLQALGEVRITSSGVRAITRTLQIDLTRASPARRTLFVAGGIAIAVAIAAVAYAFWQPGARPVTPPATALTAPSVPAGATPGRADTTHRPLPTDTSAALRPTLTSADSDAIAKAVNRRLSQRKAAPAAALSQRQLDSIRVGLEKSITDSVLGMLAAARRGSVPIPGLPPGTGHPVFPGLGAPTGPLSVVVQDVVDGSKDHTLGELARGLTDSLGRMLARRPGTRVVSGNQVRVVATPGMSSQSLGEALGADAVVQSLVQVHGDSVRMQVLLRDVKAGRSLRMTRREAPRGDAASLAGMIGAEITGWLDGARSDVRIGTGFNFFNRAAVDSAISAARRHREQTGRRPPVRPDSPPSGRPPSPGGD
jgi:serine/threonine-protein kinase